MTLIVWDGKTLAADKLRSHGYNCVKSRSVSTVNKIVVFDERKISFANANDIKRKPTDRMTEQLLVIGASGSVEKIESFYRFINLREHDDYNLPYGNRIQLFYAANKVINDFSLIVLTADVFKEVPGILCRRTLLDAKRLVLSNGFQAIGSGANLAKTLRRHFKMSAVEIVQLVSIFERSVGNGVDYIVPTDGPETHTLWNYDSEVREKHINLISDLIRKGKLSKHPNL